PQVLHQSSKHVPCRLWWFAKRAFEMSDYTTLQVTPAAKSNMQMCRVRVEFLAFFGTFLKKIADTSFNVSVLGSIPKGPDLPVCVVEDRRPQSAGPPPHRQADLAP